MVATIILLITRHHHSPVTAANLLNFTYELDFARNSKL